LTLGGGRPLADRRLFFGPNRHARQSSVTATTTDLTAPRRGRVAALQHSLPRNELFAGLYIVGCANGLLGRFIQSLHFDGWVGAILGVDINVILLFAAFAGISALLGKEKDEIRTADFAIAVIFLGLVSLPIFPLSWVAVTGLSLYILLFANG